jgi:hypothetical protein
MTSASPGKHTVRNSDYSSNLGDPADLLQKERRMFQMLQHVEAIDPIKSLILEWQKKTTCLDKVPHSFLSNYVQAHIASCWFL